VNILEVTVIRNVKLTKLSLKSKSIQQLQLDQNWNTLSVLMKE